MATSLFSIFLVIVATLIGAFGPIYLKRGSGGFTLNLFKLVRNKNIMIGLFLYAVSTVIFVPALKGGEISVLYPFVALTYVWVSLLSVRMLGEKMNSNKWMGIFFIVLGVVLIGFGS
jgi:uncharacterized membrane protein